MFVSIKFTPGPAQSTDAAETVTDELDADTASAPPPSASAEPRKLNAVFTRGEYATFRTLLHHVTPHLLGWGVSVEPTVVDHY